eukprot:sb/3474887/
MSENPPPYSEGVDNVGYKGEPSVPPAYQGYAPQDYPSDPAAVGVRLRRNYPISTRSESCCYLSDSDGVGSQPRVNYLSTLQQPYHHQYSIHCRNVHVASRCPDIPSWRMALLLPDSLLCGLLQGCPTLLPQL